MRMVEVLLGYEFEDSSLYWSVDIGEKFGESTYHRELGSGRCLLHVIGEQSSQLSIILFSIKESLVNKEFRCIGESDVGRTKGHPRSPTSHMPSNPKPYQSDEPSRSGTSIQYVLMAKYSMSLFVIFPMAQSCDISLSGHFRS